MGHSRVEMAVGCTLSRRDGVLTVGQIEVRTDCSLPLFTPMVVTTSQTMKWDPVSDVPPISPSLDLKCVWLELTRKVHISM